MFFFMISFIYFLIFYFLNIDYSMSIWFYLLGVIFLKGLLSPELKEDVFNIKKTRTLLKQNGLVDSVMEMLSLGLVFIGFNVMDFGSVDIMDIVLILLATIILYRFLFWGIIHAIREQVFNKTNNLR